MRWSVLILITSATEWPVWCIIIVILYFFKCLTSHCPAGSNYSSSNNKADNRSSEEYNLEDVSTQAALNELNIATKIDYAWLTVI